MKPYPSYKDSGVEWIGEIPSHWDVSKIKYSTDGSRDSFIDGDWIESPYIIDEGIRYITTGNIGEGKYKEQGNSFISEETFEELNCSEVFSGDLVISRLSPPVGRCCIIPDLGFRIVTSVDNVILRPKDEVKKEYLGYLFNTHRYYEYTDLISRGTTLTRISRTMLGNIHFSLPPLPEQNQIVSFLDHKTQKIDELIEKTNRKIELLKEKRASLINHCVTKGLSPNAEMKDSGVEWIGEIPKDWGIVNFGMVCSLQQGLQIPFNERFFEDNENRFEYITTQSIHNPDQPRQYIENPKSSVICDVDDVIMGRTGNTGEVVTNISGVFHNNFFLIEFDRKKIEKGFLVWYLNNPRFKEYILLLSGTTTIPDLNHGDFLSTRMLLPNNTEQQQIVEYLDQQTQKIDATVGKETQRIELLKEYRQSLISEVVTGKIDVREEMVV